MQQAENETSTASKRAAPRKLRTDGGDKISVLTIVDPFEELSTVTCGQDVIRSLLDLAQTEIEDHESGRYYTGNSKHPLKRLSHLLYAIETLHVREMECVSRAEEALFAMGVPAALRVAA